MRAFKCSILVGQPLTGQVSSLRSNALAFAQGRVVGIAIDHGILPSCELLQVGFFHFIVQQRWKMLLLFISHALLVLRCVCPVLCGFIQNDPDLSLLDFEEMCTSYLDYCQHRQMDKAKTALPT